MDKESFNLDYLSLFKKAEFIQLLDRIAASSGLVFSVADPNGNNEIKAHNYCAFCNLIRNSEMFRTQCEDSWTTALDSAVNSGKLNIMKCHAGLTMIAIPLKIKNEIAAVAIVESVTREPLNLALVVELSKKSGLNSKKLFETASMIPVWSEKRLLRMAELFSNFIDSLWHTVFLKRNSQEKFEEFVTFFNDGLSSNDIKSDNIIEFVSWFDTSLNLRLDKFGEKTSLFFNFEDADFVENEASLLNVFSKSLSFALHRGIEENTAKLKKLIEIGKQITSSLDINLIIDNTLDSLKKIVNVNWCVFGLFDKDDGKIMLRDSLGYNKKLKIDVEGEQAEGNILDDVLKTRRPLKVVDLANYDRPFGIPYCSEEVRSVVAVPIHAAGKTLGVLVVSSPFPRNWEDNEVGYISIIASQVGLAIENAKLYESLKDKFMSVVKALATALEAKDKYTQGHSLRVAHWARSVAGEMGLSDKEQEMVYIGGLLHDIGKVGVKEQILLKKDKLTPAEKEEIISHPELGVKILKPASFPKEVVEAVLYHHEDYSGGGYPKGIAGEKIPILARIIRVVDSYDAMVSNRPYRKAFSHKWVIDEMRRCSGKQFDPEVVEAMEKVLKKDNFSNMDIESVSRAVRAELEVLEDQ